MKTYVKIKKVLSLKTSDGELFGLEEERKAINHEKKLILKRRRESMFRKIEVAFDGII